MVTERRDSQRGAALFIVLLFAAFLAGLAATAMRMGLSGAQAAAVFADAARADTLGEGAAAVLASHLADADAAARRGGSIEVRLPDANIVVDYVSESARIDVNLAPLPLIIGLLGAAGGDQDEVATVANRIATFRAAAQAKAKRSTPGAGTAPGGAAPGVTSAEGAVGADAATASGPVAAGSAQAAGAGSGATPALPLALHDMSEVTSAWALPEDLARRILPVLTVSNGTAKVDPVLADRLVVAALLGSDERVDDYLNRRQQGFVDAGSALALLPVPSQAFASFKDSEAVRAIARVSVSHRFERRYEMILAPSKGPVPGGGGGGLAAAGAPAGAASAGAAPGGAASGGAGPVVVSWRKLL